MQKATKEAKVHTSWINPNDAYDAAVSAFIARLLPDATDDAFRQDISAFARRIAYFGHFVSLAQTLLKFTCPGVPDLYQGTELWDYSLVDPDNRRPVDYDARRKLLNELHHRSRKPEDLTALTRELLGSASDGRIKLFLTTRALHFRRTHKSLFAEGDYQPLEATGTKAEHVCAFARTRKERTIVVAVPRLLTKLVGGAERSPCGAEIWQDTRVILPEAHADGEFRNVFTGEVVKACPHRNSPCLTMVNVMSHFPAALLERIVS
jgi:(1->4)-alpha-D-glucan 1-alpha-D-glucosylmutase